MQHLLDYVCIVYVHDEQLNETQITIVGLGLGENWPHTDQKQEIIFVWP